MAPTVGPDEDDRRLPAGRKAQLAAYVVEAGQVTVAALATRFGVSPDTIRRDLDQLDADGVLIRTHGGALAPQAVPRPDTALDERARLQSDAKDRIGTVAAGLVQDGSVIIINAGTTALAVVRHLRQHRALTIATNNLRLPLEIDPAALAGLYVFGGAVRIGAQGTIGPVSFRTAGSGADEFGIQCELALIGMGGVSIESGYTTSHLGEAAMMRDMIARSARVAILADSSKFGRRLFAQAAELGAADYLITEREPDPPLARALADNGVEVLVPDS